MGVLVRGTLKDVFSSNFSFCKALPPAALSWSMGNGCPGPWGSEGCILSLLFAIHVQVRGKTRLLHTVKRGQAVERDQAVERERHTHPRVKVQRERLQTVENVNEHQKLVGLSKPLIFFVLPECDMSRPLSKNAFCNPTLNDVIIMSKIF